MSLRFRRSLRLAPGIRMNFGMRGASLSLGGRGSGVTFGSRGVTSHFGIPGTGLSLQQRSGTGRRTSPRAAVRTTTLDALLRIGDDGVLQYLYPDETPLPPKLVRAARQQHGDRIEGLLSAACESRRAAIREVLDVHVLTPAPGSRARFRELPFDEAEPESPGDFRPRFHERLIPALRRRAEARHSRRLQEFDEEHAAWIHRRQTHVDGQRTLRAAFDDAQSGAPEAMLALLEAHLGTLEWPRETFVSLEMPDDGSTLLLDVDLPEIEDMPTEDVSIASRGAKLNIKSRPVRQRNLDYQRHVLGVLFRVVGEVFAALPSLPAAIASGYSQRASRATGRVTDEYLVSIRVTREAWRRIGFDTLQSVDPVVALEAFETRRRIARDGRFEAIEPIRLAEWGSDEP